VSFAVARRRQNGLLNGNSFVVIEHAIYTMFVASRDARPRPSHLMLCLQAIFTGLAHGPGKLWRRLR